jgi:hypothetical protein
MTTKSPSLEEDGSAKKPYERPRLEVYGDIREITDAIDMSSPNLDSAPHSANNKTG